MVVLCLLFTKFLILYKRLEKKQVEKKRERSKATRRMLMRGTVMAGWLRTYSASGREWKTPMGEKRQEDRRIRVLLKTGFEGQIKGPKRLLLSYSQKLKGKKVKRILMY